MSQINLEQFSQGAILIIGGQIRGLNQAATTLFSSLGPGSPLPAPLANLIASPDRVGTLSVAGTPLCFSRLPVEGGELLLLQPAPAAGVTTGQLDGFLRQMRTLMQNLLLDAQFMAGAGNADHRADFQKNYCRTGRLLSNLQFLVQAQDGDVPFHPVTLDLAGLTRRTALEAASLLETAHLTLDYQHLPPSLLAPGDPALLQRLLLILLSNAAKATPPGGTLFLALEQRQGRALLMLSDGGQEAPDWQSLFSSPHPSSRPVSPQEGAGLGLAVARHIVALHSGTMLFHQGPQGGLQWAVSLPTAPLDLHLSVRSPRPDELGGLSPVLVELSDILPASVFGEIE